MLICDKCNAGINEDAKFCPQCGDPVTEADKVDVIDAENQIANVEISFGYSTSPNYKKVLGICSNLPSHTSNGENKQIQHKINLPVTEIDLIVNLFELVGSWKSSQMLINGHQATKKNLTYYGIGCYQARQKAYKPAQFCFGESEYELNIWGCKKLNMPLSSWGGGWLDFGQFDKSGLWIFDKDRIRHEIELKLKENELCPVLNRKQVLDTLDKLPNKINPEINKNWDYRTEYKEQDGGYKQIAVGIKPILKSVGSYVLGSYQPNWNIEEEEQTAITEPLTEPLTEPEPPFSIHDEKANQPRITTKEPIQEHPPKKNWWLIGIGLIILLVILLNN